MPAQELRRWNDASRARQITPQRAVSFRRLMIVTRTLALTAAASVEMDSVLSVSGFTTLQISLPLVFTAHFVWIALPFVSGLASFLTLWFGRILSGISIPPLQPTPMLKTRRALLMPIYNETLSRIFAGLQAIYESIEATRAIEYVDLFILSDSNEPPV